MSALDSSGHTVQRYGSIAPESFSGKVRVSRFGVHCFDRVSGLNILLDDIEVPEERRSLVPRYVSIALTNACELRCPFCYAPKVPGHLDLGDVLAWVEELDHAGCLGIGFGGGEPTAHPDFLRFCIEITRRTRMAVTFTTHGHRITPELAVALRGSVHFIRLSMDGVGSTYERIRGRRFKVFERQVEIVASIAPFGLNVVINEETVDELDAVAAFARSVGAAEVLLLPEQPVGSRPGISVSASQRLTDWIAGSPRGIRLSVSQAGATDGMPLANPFPDEPALDAHAHLDAAGCLRPHAYASTGVRVGASIVQAVAELREVMTS
jgi:pyruvate-formate lyase-activating enzyme